eukprot:5983203-Pyramimonas_sp.AAC.1
MTVADECLYRVPTTMLPDPCVLVSASVDEGDTSVSETLGNEPEQQELCCVSLCSTTPDEDYFLDSD